MSKPAALDDTRILVIEDNPGDVELLALSLRHAGLRCSLTVMGDGEQALAWIVSQAREQPEGAPHAVILDLNIPRNDGLEVLAAIRRSAILVGVPVVVLTSSASPREVEALEALGVTCRLTKPSELDDALAVGTVIRQVIGR